MALFIEKEALIELLESVGSLICKIDKKFSKNKDLELIDKMIDEVININYQNLDINPYLKIITYIKEKYIKLIPSNDLIQNLLKYSNEELQNSFQIM